MSHKKNIKVAIIPARYGSKRIKKKNVKNFNSKPMISWVLKKLVNSNIFDKIVVSSDSKKILRVSKKYGADILIKRPAKLSGDKIATQPVIKHALSELEKKHNFNVNYACCVYPCNPFIEIKDLKVGLNKLKKNHLKYIFPITEYAHPIQRALKVEKKNYLKSFYKKKNSDKRTQDLVKSYHDTGQFYWATNLQWKREPDIHLKGLGIIIPNWRVVDIDNLTDWKKAELVYKLINKINV